MTDAAYKAKLWLEQLTDLYADAEKTRREIEVIESRINCAVSSYENTGAGHADLIVKQQQHEDALLTYSEKQTEYERKYRLFVRYELAAINLLDLMPDYFHSALLIDRYINFLKWEEIEKIYKDEYKKSQLFRLHALALEEFAPLLDVEAPRAIQEAEATIKKYQTQAAAC